MVTFNITRRIAKQAIIMIFLYYMWFHLHHIRFYGHFSPTSHHDIHFIPPPTIFWSYFNFFFFHEFIILLHILVIQRIKNYLLYIFKCIHFWLGYWVRKHKYFLPEEQKHCRWCLYFYKRVIIAEWDSRNSHNALRKWQHMTGLNDIYLGN